MCFLTRIVWKYGRMVWNCGRVVWECGRVVWNWLGSFTATWITSSRKLTVSLASESTVLECFLKPTLMPRLTMVAAKGINEMSVIYSPPVNVWQKPHSLVYEYGLQCTRSIAIPSSRLKLMQYPWSSGNVFKLILWQLPSAISWQPLPIHIERIMK